MCEEKHLFKDMRILRKNKSTEQLKRKNIKAKISLGRESTTLRLTEIWDKGSFICKPWCDFRQLREWERRCQLRFPHIISGFSLRYSFPEEVMIILFSIVFPSFVFPTRSIPPQLCYSTVSSTRSCLHKKHSFQTNHMITQRVSTMHLMEVNLTSSVPLLKSFKVLYLNDFFKRSEWSQSAKERGLVY